MYADYMILESDISNEAAVKEIYSKVFERYGRVDILVNNAADGDMDGVDTIEKITQNVIDDTFCGQCPRKYPDDKGDDYSSR